MIINPIQLKNLPEITSVDDNDLILIQTALGLTGKVKKSIVISGLTVSQDSNVALEDSDILLFNRNGTLYGVSAFNLKAYANGLNQVSEDVALLLNFDESPIIDSSTFGHSPNIEGNTVIVSDTVRGSVVSFDGNGDYISFSHASAFVFGTADFSISFYLNTGLSKFQTLVDMRPDNTNGSYVFLGLNTSGSINLYVIDGNKITTANDSITANTWQKVELKRVNGQTKILINDNQSGSTWNDTTNYTSTIFRLAKSAFSGARPTEDYIGKIDLVKVARYTLLS